MGLFDLATGGGGLDLGSTAGPSQAGPASGSASVGGLTSPVVVGGFKTDGTANAAAAVVPGVVQSWMIPAAIGVAVLLGLGALLHWRRKG